MITSESVREIFAQSNISKVAIIDDAFDDPGTSLSPADLQTIFQGLTEADVRRALRRLDLTVHEPDDINPDLIVRLKALAAANDEDGKQAWAVIQTSAKGRRAALDALTNNLRRGLRLSVKPISARRAQTARKVVPDDSNVVFLDYQMDGDQGELSAELLKRIYDQFRGKDVVPLVILMSSLRLDEKQILNFQSQTELLSGMFYFVPKDDLFEVEKLHYRLAAFAKSLSTGQTLQRFVHTVEESVEAVRQAVFSDVRALSIADYAFLQTMRLHDDGQPLGEYLMWAISAHLLKELAAKEEVQKLEAQINALSFDHLPPTQAKPSPKLAALYSSAVVRAVPDLPKVAEDPATYLQFGDLFRKGKANSVWLCVTPACDLAFSPTRPIPSGRSLLFIPGKLQRLEKPLKAFDQRKPRTELVRLGEETFRVVWEPKEVVRTAWADLQDWTAAAGVKRVARLHTPFALDVQRGFTAELTRIGMPAPPPVYRAVKVRLFCLDKTDAAVELTDAATTGALISGSERNQRLILGAEFMDHLVEMLASAETHAKERKAEVAKIKGKGPALLAQATTAVEKLTAARRDADVLSNLRGPHELPSVGEHCQVLEELMLICNETNAAFDQEWIPLRLVVEAAETE